MIAIVKYNEGDCEPHREMLLELGAEVIVTDRAKDVKAADALILPGIDPFDDGMRFLRSSGIHDIIIKKAFVENAPILGICLGMQMFARTSEEGELPGFGWFESDVKRFDFGNEDVDLPHKGLNAVSSIRDNPLLKGIRAGHLFYFEHSFHHHFDDPQNDAIIGTSNYGYDFPCAIRRENVFGVQFHPQKSGDAGKIVFKNLLDMI